MFHCLRRPRKMLMQWNMCNCVSRSFYKDPYLFLLVGISVKLCPSIRIEPETYIYFIASGVISVYPKWLKMIFSQMKEYIFTSEIQQIDVIFTTRFELRRCFSHCFPNRYRSHFVFFSFLFFWTSLFLSKTNKCRYAFSLFLSKTIKCRYAFSWL